MINVAMEHRQAGIWIEVTGHASTDGSTEGIQVCAAVSVLMTTLHSYGAPDRYSFLAQDKGGHVAVLVPLEHVSHLQFVFRGFELINEAYPGRLRLPEGAKELETLAWKEAPTRPEGRTLPPDNARLRRRRWWT